VGQSNIAQALGNLNQQNIAQNLAPQATAGIVGSGQFGSSRGAGALGQVISNADIATQAQQAQAMQQDEANRLAASQQLGNLATTTQNLGLGDVNALATLGAQQQQIAQNQQLFPMTQLTSESSLLKGATIPTATSSSYTGPIPGAYNASPLSQIAGLGSLATGISNLVPQISAGLSGINFSSPTGPVSAQITNPTIGDSSTNTTSPTLPSGAPNPNYDVYADPNATPAQIAAFNQQQIQSYNANNNITPNQNNSTDTSGELNPG